MVPAYFIQAGSFSFPKVDSNDSRTTLPTGKPVRRDFSRKRFSSSSESRIVSVLLIRQYCNTPVLWECPGSLSCQTPDAYPAIRMQLLQRTDLDFSTL